MRSIIVLLAISLLLGGCTQNQQSMNLSSNNSSTGLSYDQALAIANSSSACLSAGNLNGSYIHNDITGSWWFDIVGNKSGCSPACVVYDANQSSEMNWRCTGLIPQQPIVMTFQHLTLGKILVDINGRTLYVFLKDEINQSNCSGDCAAIWPPLLYNISGTLSGLPGTLGMVNRSDGSVQITYNGMPLYYYSGDKGPGDVKGQGFNNLWWVAQPNMTTFPSPIMIMEEAVAIANSSTCIEHGNLTGTPSYNNNSMTWWINLDTVMPGCSPACVVYSNGSAEVNWRCTGLLPQNSSTAPQSTPVVKEYQNPTFGEILTGPDGKALYVYIKDSPYQSTCTDGCSANWPPLILQNGYTTNITLPGTLSTIRRSDGSLQVTYNGMPLYNYIGDNSPGLVMGNGIGGLWYVVSPNMTTFPTPPTQHSGGY